MVSNSLTDRLLVSRPLARLPRFAMLIVCPNCATSYQVDPLSLGHDGRSVRCARCKNVWFAAVPTVVPPIEGETSDIVDEGPRVPAVDAPAPLPSDAEPALAASPSEVSPEAFSSPAADDPAAQGLQENPRPDPASTEGIDLAGLSSEIESQRMDEIAEADIVLAQVTAHESPPGDAPILMPSAPGGGVEAPAEAIAVAAGEDIESAAARRARRERTGVRRSIPVPGLPSLLVALVAANTVMVGWRNDIVRLLPQTASLYAAVGIPVNVRGLTFEDVKISRDTQDNVPVLVVEGVIVNVTAKAVEVPRLRLSVRNDTKSEIYAWTALPARAILGPGEKLPFRSRLASPPADARDILVRFFSRRDLIAQVQ